MNNQLHTLLLLYFGDLLYKKGNTFDWIEKEAIIRKINACYELLDIDNHEETFIETATKKITNETIN